MRQLSLVGFRWRRKHRCNSGAYRGTHRHTVTWSACNSSTSRYDKDKRMYHRTANRMTSGSNCRHLNKPQTKDARRSIQLPYHRMTAKLHHFPFGFCGLCREAERRFTPTVKRSNLLFASHAVCLLGVFQSVIHRNAGTAGYRHLYCGAGITDNRSATDSSSRCKYFSASKRTATDSRSGGACRSRTAASWQTNRHSSGERSLVSASPDDCRSATLATTTVLVSAAWKSCGVRFSQWFSYSDRSRHQTSGIITPPQQPRKLALDGPGRNRYIDKRSRVFSRRTQRGKPYAQASPD